MRPSAHVLPIVVRAARVPAPEVKAELVRIDVVVADTAGQPVSVSGLAREDFEGTVDGRPERMTPLLDADEAAALSALVEGAALSAAPLPALDPTERGPGSGREPV